MIRFLSAAAVVALVVSDTPAQTNSVDILGALPIAQGQVSSGQLLQARVENKSTGPVFGFYFLLNGQIYEVEVTGDGKVAKKKAIDPIKKKDDGKPVGNDKDDPPIDPAVADLLTKQKAGKAKLPDGRLLELAAAASGNTPISDMKYEVRDGKLVIVVGSTVIDATTGQVVSK